MKRLLETVMPQGIAKTHQSAAWKFTRWLTALLLLVAACPAKAASPALGSITPRGVQRGVETELYFNGGRLSDAQEILFYYPGVQVLKLDVVNDGQVKVRVKTTPDCRLGEHAARVRAASGISELKTFWVGALPAVEEKEPNNDFAQPQKIALNVTVTGVVQSEDVDYFLVEAKKGQRISAEIEGMRLANDVFDPYVAILNSKRFELAVGDDSPLVWQDAVAAVVAPEDGNYVIQVRETSYGGNGNCLYRLHVGTFPRPTAVLPAGGKMGDEIDVRFLGDPTGPLSMKLKLPTQFDSRFGLIAQDAGGVSPSMNAFRLSKVGNVLEAEPNNEHQKATVAQLPLALNGIIGEKGDVDYFRFKAKKGETYDVHCYARRIRSALDAVMVIDHFAGGGLVGNDDAVGPDSYFRVTFPEDKEYAISIRDHLGKGGPEYVYRVEFTPVTPSLSLSIPKVSLFSQERQTIPVPRGNRYAALIAANRINFGGELVMGCENLPKGISIASENMAGNLNLVPVLFEAAADAPIAGTMANLTARHVDPKQSIAGGFSHVVELATGGPGQSVYWQHEVNKLAAAVTQEVPFKINIVEPKVPLVQNGAMNLKVVAERKGDFKAPINVYMLFNPPGVGSAPGVTMAEGQNEVLYPLNANGGAEVKKWKIVVIAQATVGNGPVWVASQLATLEVAPAFVSGQIQLTAAEQGKPAEVVCKLNQQMPFDGKAKMQLLGLPALCTTKEVEISKENKEIVFPIQTEKTSPVGQHGTLLCQLTIVKNSEPILHYFGHGGVLRIDPPPPPKPNAPAPAAAKEQPKQAAPAPAAAKPEEKRLTRLEKLRLEAAERAKATKK